MSFISKVVYQHFLFFNLVNHNEYRFDCYRRDSYVSKTLIIIGYKFPLPRLLINNTSTYFLIYPTSSCLRQELG